MDTINQIINVLVFQVLTQPPVFMGLIALVGYVVQKKTIREVLEGTLRTIIGMYAFFAGAGLIFNMISPVNEIMKPSISAIGTYALGEPAFAIAMTYVAQSAVLSFVVGWFIHLLLVKVFTKTFPAIFLTLHHMLFDAALVNLFLVYVMKMSGASLIITAAILCALYWSISPAIVYKFSKKFNGDKFTLAHKEFVGVTIASLIAPLVGNPKTEDADNLKLPGWLSMFADVNLSLAVTMPIFFIIIGIIAIASGKPEAIAALNNVVGSQNWVVWLLLAGIQLAAGVAVLLFGLRMFVGALLPAFKGIQEKFIPGAIPALDCPVFYPLSPMGTALGFIGSSIAGILSAILLVVIKAPLIVYPTLVIAFFDGGTIGVFGNKLGGWKGALVGSFIGGLLFHLGVILINPFTGPLATSGFQFSGSDPAILWSSVFTVFRAVGRLFGLGV